METEQNLGEGLSQLTGFGGREVRETRARELMKLYSEKMFTLHEITQVKPLALNI